MFKDFNLETANQIMLLFDLPKAANVVNIKEFNHVYKIMLHDGQILYLKTYTKDWYGDFNNNAKDISGCVVHEACAYKMLKSNGLPAPNIVLSEETDNNPFGRPFLLLSELKGSCLTNAFENNDIESIAAQLISVGQYMKKMHNIVMSFPGYIMTLEGPMEMPDTNWQHSIWTKEHWQKVTSNFMNSYLKTMDIPEPTIIEANKFYNENKYEFEKCYDKYVFVHGDCHASQFFLKKNGMSNWEVSGVVDMEVASSGAAIHDLMKISIELAAKAFHSDYYKNYNWWEPLFSGYGGEPNFNAFKIGWLTTGAESFWCQNWTQWSCNFDKIYQHILQSQNWRQLFDLSNIRTE